MSEIDMKRLEAAIEQRHRNLSAAEAQRAAHRVRALGPESLARGLHVQRIRLNLSQRQAAELIGVQHMTYHNWELGRYWPTSIYLPLIAEAFGCGIAELFLEEVQDA